MNNFKFSSKFFLGEDVLKVITQPDFQAPYELIHHMRSPMWVATVQPTDGDDLFTDEGILSRVATYINSEGLLELHRLTIRRVYDEAALEQLEEDLEKAIHWYVSYMAAEDQKGGKPMLRYYNEKLKDLRVGYREGVGWMIIYRGIIKKFAVEPEMDDFLINKLGINEADLNEGYINEF